MLEKLLLLLVLLSANRILYAQEHRLIIVPARNEMLILDRFHRAFDEDDMEENTVYVLRNTLIRELLQTRKELKYFIGGLQRAREIALDNNLTFELDRSTCRLYLENCDADSINIETEKIGQTGDAMFVRTPLYEIHQAISDLYLTKVNYDEDMRTKLVLGLIHLSAILTKLDRYISYFRKDVWQYKNLLPVDECDDKLGRDFIPYLYVGRKNCMKKLKAEGKKIIDFLTYYRAMIINHYHILVTRVRYDSRSEQLYKLIYRELEKTGFPSLHKPLKPRKNYRKLSWPDDYFEDRIQTAIRHLETKDKLMIVFPRINNYLDMALLSALKANSAVLRQLGKDIHFHSTSSLMFLTTDERLWQKAVEEYSYLTPVIDFSRVKQAFAENKKETQRRNNKVRNFSNYVGGGFGVLGLANTINLPPLLRKRPIAASLAWLVTGGILTYNELTDFIRNGAKTNNMMQNYFGNSHDGRSLEELQSALQTRRRDGQTLALSLLLLGADLAFLNKLTRVFSNLYVKITRDNRIRDGADVVASRLKTKIVDKHKTMKTTLIKFKDSFHTDNPHIDRALQFLGKTWGIPRKILDRTLYQIVPRQRLEEMIRKRLDDPHFFPHLFNLTSVSLFHLTLTEWGLYRDSIKYNLDRIAIDYISSIFFSVMLTWINFGHKPTTFTPFRNLFKKRKDLNFQMLKNTTKEATGIFKSYLLRGMGIGFIGTLPAVSMVEISQLRRGEKTSKEALRNIMAMSIFGTAYIATISNIRAQMLREIRKVWAREDIHFILNNANSLFGQWLWIRLKDTSGAYKKSELVGKDNYYLIKKVQKEGERSHLFDFMNDIEHPAVSLNLPDYIERNFIE